MYSTGDKYDIPSLKEKAVQKFRTAIMETTVVNESENPREGYSLLDEMMEAVPHIYSSTPDGDRRLRDIAVDVVLTLNWQAYIRPEKEDLMDAVPEFFQELSTRSCQLAKYDFKVLRTP